MAKNFKELLSKVSECSKKTLAVACAQDQAVLEAVKEANERGIASSILVGDEEKIREIAASINMDLSDFKIINVVDTVEASLAAVKLVHDGEADMYLKGLLDTKTFLKSVLDKEVGLRTGNILSHVAVFDIEGYDRLFFITDAAMNQAPDVNGKKQIIENACSVARALDIEEPKVALICAKEKVNPKMKDTVEAKELEDMYLRGEIKNCIVGGPFALDNAINEEAAKHKGMNHPVAGKADILVVPDIEAGNVLYKSITYFSKCENAGLIVGAKAPIILTSRADSDKTKLNSIALGVLASTKK